MGMSLRLGQRMDLRDSLRLNQSQKLKLRQLLDLRLELIDPPIPHPVKGLEGMLTAHKILQSKQCTGVLIGGLSESIWNQRRTKEQLYSHKDTDVLILGDFEYKGRFEGGIDWWRPQEERIKIAYDSGTIEKYQKWYSNDNGTILRFGVRQSPGLKPGLYLPDRDFIVNMRLNEALASISASVEVEYDIQKVFHKKLQKSLGKRVPKFVEEAFKGFILSSDYEQDYYKYSSIAIEGFDNQTIIGINSYFGKYLETKKEK